MPDGKEIYKSQRIYMPVPQQFGVGDKMGRGPYEKSGILRETSLPPLKPVIEKFEVPIYSEEKKNGTLVRTPLGYEFNVEVELWYLPYGKKEDPGNAQMWQKFTKKITLEKGGK